MSASVVAIPRTDPASVARYALQLAAVQAVADTGGEIGIAFLGDSLTEGWVWHDTWTTVWRPRHALNFGIGGERTGHLLFRLRNGLLDGVRLRVVVQLIGVNDLWSGAAPEPTIAGIDACLAEVRARQPAARVLCLGVLPTGGECFGFDPQVRAVNAALPAVAARHGAEFRDLRPAFPRDERGACAAHMSDGVHLSADGYAVLSRELLAWFQPPRFAE